MFHPQGPAGWTTILIVMGMFFSTGPGTHEQNPGQRKALRSIDGTVLLPYVFNVTCLDDT